MNRNARAVTRHIDIGMHTGMNQDVCHSSDLEVGI